MPARPDAPAFPAPPAPAGPEGDPLLSSLLRAISDSSDDVIFAKDREGRLRFANPATLALVGKPLDAVLGRTDAEFLQDPRAAREVMANDRRVMDGGVAVELEEEVPLPDGTRRVWLSRKVPYRDASGAVVGLFGISRDITDRKRGEEALRESDLRMRRLFEAIPIGVVVGDGDGRLFDANDAYLRILGRRREELASGLLRWDALTPPEYLGRDAQAVEEARGRGVSSLYEKEYLRPGGVRVPVLVGCAAFGSGGELVAFVVDITERKRIEEALRESDRRKSEFLAVLSHELRNPLAPIRNGVYVLGRAPPGSEQAVRASEVIRRQSEHLTRLVDDLLDITRVSRGKIMLDRARIDLRDVVRRTTDDLGSVFGQAGVELRVDHPSPGPVWIDADATRVAQVVGNLLQNAVKFTPAGGRVVVTVAAREGAAELRVADTGVGMDPARVDEMFEPFAQAEQTLARTRGGLGLGLALVKGIVELHGGRVTARSEGPGRGAEFAVTLPLAPGPPEARGSAAASARPGRRVLLVEDNLDAAETLADLLGLHGHRVELAHDGRTGVRLARERRPDVVLCDLGLPDVDGYEVARALRAAGGDDLLLVALSGYAQPEDHERSREAGFDAHLAKPADLDELLRVLDRARPRGG